MRGVPSAPVGRIGRFDLLGRLASGGMAEIFLACPQGTHGDFRRLFALKRILPHVARDPLMRTMFLQEAKLCLHLNHPAVCAVHEFGEDGPTLFLVMEWVHGVTVRKLLERATLSGGLPIPLGVRIAATVAAALHHVHTATDAEGRALGVIHRDLTPENVMVSFDGHVKVIDFGVAKAASQLVETQKGVLKGKFAYMSPEQYAGKTLDARADVFSLGACLYELLCGISPFARGSEYETVAAIVANPEQTPVRALRPQIPDVLSKIIERALRRDRDERFASAEQLRFALEDYLRTTGEPVLETALGDYVGRLFHDEIQAGVQVDVRTIAADDERPLSALDQQLLAAELEDVEEDLAARGSRRRRVTALLVASAITAVAAIYGYFLWGGP